MEFKSRLGIHGQRSRFEMENIIAKVAVRSSLTKTSLRNIANTISNLGKFLKRIKQESNEPLFEVNAPILNSYLMTYRKIYSMLKAIESEYGTLHQYSKEMIKKLLFRPGSA